MVGGPKHPARAANTRPMDALSLRHPVDCPTSFARFGTAPPKDLFASAAAKPLYSPKSTASYTGYPPLTPRHNPVACLAGTRAIDPGRALYSILTGYARIFSLLLRCSGHPRPKKRETHGGV